MAKNSKTPEKAGASTGGRDKQAVKAASKNAKAYRKMQRKERNKRRNSYIAAARYVAAAVPFALIVGNGVIESRESDVTPESYLLPALAAFFLVWFLLGFAERAISAGIQKLALEEREAARTRAAELAQALDAAEAASSSGALTGDDSQA